MPTNAWICARTVSEWVHLFSLVRLHIYRQLSLHVWVSRTCFHVPRDGIVNAFLSERVRNSQLQPWSRTCNLDCGVALHEHAITNSECLYVEIVCAVGSLEGEECSFYAVHLNYLLLCFSTRCVREILLEVGRNGFNGRSRSVRRGLDACSESTLGYCCWLTSRNGPFESVGARCEATHE